MEIIFREHYVEYNEISEVSINDIKEVLNDNSVSITLGDGFNNDWCAYAYYYCKSLNQFDEETINSFVYIITWFMTGNPIDITLKSSEYFKNDLIFNDCLTLYEQILEKSDSPKLICKELFKKIYDFYLNNSEKYIKKSERINCVLTYKELRMLNNIPCKNKTDKIRFLLRNYYDK